MTVFDTFAAEYSFWEQTCSPHRYGEILSFLPGRVNRALDAGCGSGSLTLRLADSANRVVGVDMSHSSIELAKEYSLNRHSNNVDFVVADLENLPFHEGLFGFVASYGSLHHARLEITLPGLRRLVKPGGRMVVLDYITPVPNLSGSRSWQIWRALRSAPGYVRFFGFRTMWRIERFRTSRVWLRHVCNDKLLTPVSLRDSFSFHLPGCRLVQYRWAVAAFWENVDRMTRSDCV